MILEVLSKLLDLLGKGNALARERGEMRDAALDSVYMACTETKAYMVDYERSGRRDHDRERELAKLWKKAAIPVRHFDAELADKCYYKGEYWLNPDNWHDGDSRRLKIDLDRVIMEAKDLKVMSDDEYEMQRLWNRDA